MKKENLNNVNMRIEVSFAAYESELILIVFSQSFAVTS